MPRSPVLAAIAGIVLAVGLASCATEAPVALGGGYESCIQTDAEMATFGDVLRTSPGASVVMDSVQLVDPEGLELRESYLVPIENRTSLGTDAYPPDPQFWDRRIAVRGSEIGPATDTTVMFAVATVGGGDVHRSTGYTARYWLDGRLYEATSTARFVVAPDCSTLDQEW